MKICESCVYHRRILVDVAPFGINAENRRKDADGNEFYLLCTQFNSYPSANLKVFCTLYTPAAQTEKVSNTT